MKENKYDSDSFFEKYSRFPRSVMGLSAAGEWETLKSMLPDFHGKAVLDLGCGFGWHCRWAAEHGAVSVTGVDLSERMLARAREMSAAYSQILYLHAAMEDVPLEKDAYDIAISSLALHYVADFQAVAKKVYDSLKPRGAFIFSVEHPVFTAQGPQDWMYGQDGALLCWPVDAYFLEGQRQAVFLGETMTKYHRTLTGYVQALFKAGFTLDDLQEPQPTPEMLVAMPQMRDELRRPMMLILSARK